MAEVCYSAAKTMPFWWMLFVSLLYLSKCKSLKIAAVNIVGNESDEFIEIGPICNTDTYIQCHLEISDNYLNFCSFENFFCKCYYIDVLLYHCTGFCTDGINFETWKLYDHLCISKKIRFNLNNKRSSKSGKLLDYGHDSDDSILSNNQFIRQSLVQ